MPTDYQALFEMLSSSGCRFVLVGGLATVLHGVDRVTADVDLVIDLAPESVTSLVDALTRAGYRPMAPVDPQSLARSDIRQAWQRDHGMQVFCFWDSEHRRPTVDILLSADVPFAELLRDAIDVSLRGVTVKVASIDHLVRMKRRAGRAQDLADIERLQELQRRAPRT